MSERGTNWSGEGNPQIWLVGFGPSSPVTHLTFHQATPKTQALGKYDGCHSRQAWLSL